MSEGVWLDPRAILAAHEEQLAEHGGAEGVRDMGAFETAMARPQNVAAYGEPDIAACAAAYAFGTAKNYPFVDGNKRTALVALETFLILNGRMLDADDADCAITIFALAAGELSEGDVAAWVRKNLK